MENYTQFYNRYSDENPTNGDSINIDRYSVALINAYIQFQRDRREKYCAVCGKELDIFDLSNRAPCHFNIVCTEHSRFGELFQLDIAMDREGISWERPERKQFFDNDSI